MKINSDIGQNTKLDRNIQKPLRGILFFLFIFLVASCTTSLLIAATVNNPPVIGITGYANNQVSSDGSVPKFKTSMSYWKAIEKAGGIAIRLLPVSKEKIPIILDRLDGVLLCGGPDISPEKYGEKPHPSVNVLSKLRENFDFALAEEAIKRDMPVLGICLGSQMINVIKGGTLVQDIPSCVSRKVHHRPVVFDEIFGPMHEVKITRGTKIASFYNAKTIEVNSYHHQAVKKIGKGLAVAFRSTGDGVVEGFEDPSAFFLIGVQFHPELQQKPAGLHDKLFTEFIKACTDFGSK